jgi:competence protein ComEA
VGEVAQQEGLGARLEAWRADRRVVAGVCACVAVAAGVAWWRAGSTHTAPPAPAPATQPRASEVVTTSTTRAPAALVVDVVGAVRRPGIVRVAAGARVFDVIRAAGGATAGADLTRLNLAAPIADGARVAVPALGQPAPGMDPGAVTGGAAGSAGSGVPGRGGGADGPVNLNTATVDALDALPGVGPATAAAIVRDREQHGPFRSVGDLERVRGIGPAKLEQLHDLVIV